MAEPRFQMEAEEGLEDLPRTLRREHEARQREARERDARERGPAFTAHDTSLPDQGFGGGDLAGGYGPGAAEPVAATVRRIDVPFFSLMAFFLKAVLAAIPALVVLGALLWGAGEILQSYFPWLIKMKITIAFPG
ncbi:MAG: hypothetical protein NW217_16640 [Hyphomicrobiaceae bacterium]|nr:hypothetical protein [Hyphomicrobiaceae bacterium]